MAAHVAHVFAYHRRVVYLQDDVTLFQPGLGSGVMLIRLVYHHPLELQVILDDSANACILARHHGVKVLHILFGIVNCVGIKRAQHGIDGRAHHIVGVERVNIQHVEVFIDIVKDFEVLGNIKVMLLVTVLCQGRHTCQQDKNVYYQFLHTHYLFSAKVQLRIYITAISPLKLLFLREK